MTPDRALAESIAFLQGVGDKDPTKAAGYVVEQLSLRGFSVQPISAPVLHDLTPETLLRVRKALGLTQRQVGTVAGLAVMTVNVAERGASRPQIGTLQKIGDALVQLGALRAAHVDYVEALNHAVPEGALSGLALDDKEGALIRASLDLVGQARDPPVSGVAAIRAALKDYLIGVGRWPMAVPGEDE